MPLLEELLAKWDSASPEARKKMAEIACEVGKGMKWLPNPGPQTAAFKSEADQILYGGEVGGGKLISNTYKVPVPLSTDVSGFKNHGDLAVGDFVFSPTGSPVEVLWVSPVRENTDAYELVFDTGERIQADGDHLWLTWTQKERDNLLKCSDEWRAKRRASRPSRAKLDSKRPWLKDVLSKINHERSHEIAWPTGAVRTTREISMTLRDGKSTNHSVDLTAPVLCPDIDLPIDPYLFGLWIGDGSSGYPEIGMLSEDWANIDVGVPDKVKIETKGRARQFEYRVFKWMRPFLKDLGVWKAKRLPPLYLRASYAQRIALLQGIMDTDGYCDKTGKLGCGFSNEELAGDLQELISSLGVKSTLRRKKTHSQNGPAKDHFRTTFLAPFPAFRLKRKLERQKLDGFRDTVTRRYITAVRKIPSVPMRCIKVASTSGLYLLGRSFIPTHNTDLLIGMALEKHKRSLILRRLNKEVNFLVERTEAIVGDRTGYNGQKDRWNFPDGKLIQYGGCQHPGDEKGYKGEPKDFIGVDEATEFLEAMIDFLVAWLRTSDETQRCQLVLATNPPTTVEGEWVVRWFAPWLDRSHAFYPQPFGKLLWFIRDGDHFKWFESGDIVEHNGLKIKPLSRTFIRSGLKDNPDYAKTDYGERLKHLPDAMRRRYAEGDFTAGFSDDEWQVIPTQWIIAAQERWESDGWRTWGKGMTAMGLDPAGGGSDAEALAFRYGAWLAPIIVTKGEETADGSITAARVVRHRRDGCPVVVDVGGGYGGAVCLRLRDNGIGAIRFNGAESSNRKTRDRALTFANKRAEGWWRLREELNPDQEGGSPVCLPPDPELRADLAAPTWQLGSTGVRLESKQDIKKRIGRSPDKGDAVVMCFSDYARKLVYMGGPTSEMGGFGEQGFSETMLPRTAIMARR